MKKLFLAFVIMAFGMNARAQNNELELVQSVFQVEKKALLMDFLQLDEAESPAFWPIYEAYLLERSELAKQRIALINKYAEEFETITPEQADELVAATFKLRSSIEKLHKKYYKKIKKELDAKRAAQFVQFERFVDVAITNELNNNMPLIGEKL